MNDDTSLFENKPVDVNKAGVELLRDGVVGIGQVLAERIIAYREEHGVFASLEELEQVSGIGPSLLGRIADQLTVEETPEESGAAQPAEPVQAPQAMPGEGGGAESEERSEEPRTPPAESEERAAEPEPVTEQVVGAPAAPAPAPKRAVGRSGLWPNFVLVLLGGLAGVVLTLLIAVIWAGTVDFAPRREVDALSQNMSTMQANQDLAWTRLDQLALEADDLGRDVEGLEDLNRALGERTGALEQTMREVQVELAKEQEILNGLSTDLRNLDAKVDDAMQEMDGRMSTAEDTLARVSASLEEVAESVEALDARVGRFDAFFSSLRDLLIDMQGTPPSGEDGSH